METADSLANEVDQNSLRSTGQDLAEGPIYSYELVQEVEIDYTRPVVILGRLLPMVHDYDSAHIKDFYIGGAMPRFLTS